MIFDSDREAAQMSLDPDSNSKHHPHPPGTKFTVMLGGHHWNGLPDEFLPDTASAIAAAQSVVSRHLGIPPSLVGASSAKLCRACIPQHVVGHLDRLVTAHKDLQSSFGGRLAVAGASYSPPGVLPGLRAGRDVASQIAGRRRPPPGGSSEEQPWSVGDTGLGGVMERLWGRFPKGQLPFVRGTGWTGPTLKPGGEGVKEGE